MPKTKKENKNQKNETKFEKKYPVVAVMGHVDHGKTTFLDAIRGSNMADKEAGGITQNTRAHEIILESGFRITFIDTPGHEAFAKMRLRSAQVTDFVLLIVAADDGVQPQTKQSIKFAKESNVPIIVAINKIDIPGVNTQKIKKELSNYDVLIEEYGGDVLCFEISAKNKTGLKELLEGIELLTEIQGLKNTNKSPGEMLKGEAFILESVMDKKLGNVALCILKTGNLNIKNKQLFGVCEDVYFKVRAFLNHEQKNIEEVKISQPFWVLGLKNILSAGSFIKFYESEDFAKKMTTKKEIEETKKQIDDPHSVFMQLLQQKDEEKKGISKKILNIIIKSKTQGTLEAIKEKVENIATGEAKVNILNIAVGDVTEQDIQRAKLAKGIILTFQTPISTIIQNIARKEKVLVRNYEVIYEMFDELQEVLESMEEPLEEEIDIAKAKIKKIFVLSDGSQVLGCEIIQGNFSKGFSTKIVNVNTENELGRGKIISLKILKNEVKEVKKGQECGIILDKKIDDVKEGDLVVAYKIEKY